MKIDKYWLFKVHSMAEEGDDPGKSSLLPEGGDPPADPAGDPPAGDPPADPAGENDWFKKDKYKTVEDQAKAYNDLEKKLGETSTLTGAPEEDYVLTMPEGMDAEFMEGNPALDGFKEVAKEMNLSQEAFDKILGKYLEAEAAMTGTSVEQEMKALGDNADRRLKDLADFGSANLSKEDYEAFRAVASTAAGVTVLEAMKSLTKEHKLPGDGEHVPGNTGMTPEILKEMMAKKDDNGNRLMSLDPAYKKKVDKAYNDYYGSAPKSSVVG